MTVKSQSTPSCSKKQKHFSNIGHVAPGTWKIKSHNLNLGHMDKVQGGTKKILVISSLQKLHPFKCRFILFSPYDTTLQKIRCCAHNGPGHPGTIRPLDIIKKLTIQLQPNVDMKKYTIDCCQSGTKDFKFRTFTFFRNVYLNDLKIFTNKVI